jgi:hypothetical protein
MTKQVFKTLGDLKDAGLVPSEYHIWRLEMEESKTCKHPYGPNPHTHHSYMLSNNRIVRDPCPRIQWLHLQLMKMFPELKLELK